MDSSWCSLFSAIAVGSGYSMAFLVAGIPLAVSIICLLLSRNHVKKLQEAAQAA